MFGTIGHGRHITKQLSERSEQKSWNGAEDRLDENGNHDSWKVQVNLPFEAYQGYPTQSAELQTGYYDCINTPYHPTMQDYLFNHAGLYPLAGQYPAAEFWPPQQIYVRPGYPQNSTFMMQQRNSLPMQPPPGLQPVTDQLRSTHVQSHQPLPSPQISQHSPVRALWSDSATCHDLSSSADMDDSDESMEEGDRMSHPNKYPVQIENHESKQCGYRLQATRSGPKIKQRRVSVYNPMKTSLEDSVQHIKYYQKDLVRICRCGRYPQMDEALTHGRSNGCDGYEIHYNQKCKWKAYDDFKTGKRVLVRLCKCYKPT